ncbi:MAG TPA: hypothetical protein VJ201_02010 [Candidatus Babeliales bacterium]|nr:hypothetical protein [Candidatus Babeliales bacterium]
MKTITFLLKNPLVLVIFFSSIYAHGMDLACQQVIFNTEQIPNEMWIHIFSYCCTERVEEESLFNTFFDHCIVFKDICKRFNTMLTLKVIGELCKGHTVEDKNKMLQWIVRTASSVNYYIKRPTILALLYSGASANIGNHTKYSRHVEIDYSDFSLLHKVLIKNDIAMLKLLLLDLNADPNQLHPNSCPLFFLASTIDIADLFFKKGANFNAKDKNGNTVLWSVHKISLELIQFYIDHNVDTRYINPLDSTCILHILANPSFKYIQDSNNFYKKGVLLIKAIPDMVNTLDKAGKTSIDLMEEKTKREFYNNSTYYAKPLKQLIAVYRSYEGKTAQELTKENKLYIHRL